MIQINAGDRPPSQGLAVSRVVGACRLGNIGKRWKDSSAAFRNWLRKAQEFHDERKGNSNSASAPPGYYVDKQGVLRSEFTGSVREGGVP